MVRICDLIYPKQNEETYNHYFNKYSYPLYDFQKWCVEGIVEGHHVLACCPTGSGKTFGGEFAIEYFYSKGKKIIYCSPIKALSNQKFYDFTKKFPYLSVGLITGDIKTNPDADVLIMTTEILLNKLYQIKNKSPSPTSSISFDMDIEHELSCVVFDEIHMINDEARGHVWEQSIIMLPRHVQIVGLSATLENPEKFANWLETKGDISNSNNKIVYLTTKKNRSVPLTHYTFIASASSVFKHIKDKQLQQDINSIANKPQVIQSANGAFDENNYNKMHKVLRLYEQNNIKIHRPHVLNSISSYLFNNDMLPALCYVFSRKQLEICAKEVTTNLLELDSKIPYNVDYECEQIIRKLPNYQEYLHLPEYTKMVQLLRKGIGMHHAGLMPILREMVELLFAKGYIKLLFCTETMSVGINLPVKTTIFTDINKFDGNNNRMLYGHEYNQAAGRAGRLGLDTVGHVIHLNNLFRHIDTVGYKIMLRGQPQILCSKFKISYNLLLNLIGSEVTNFIGFAEKSMITDNINSQLIEIQTNMTRLKNELTNLLKLQQHIRTPLNKIEELLELYVKRETAINKQRKDIARRINYIIDENPFIENDKRITENCILKKKEIAFIEQQYNTVYNYISGTVNSVINLLVTEGFLLNDPLKLTERGIFAMHIKEVNCLAFARILEDTAFTGLTTEQLVSVFSCFTSITVNDELKNYGPKVIDTKLLDIINKTTCFYDEYKNKEVVNSGLDYSYHYDLMGYVIDWCNCDNIVDCKQLIQTISNEKNIFLGEFVKAILKINNIAAEFEKIAEITNNISFLSNLKDIPKKTLKFIVTNQSLYV